MLLGALTHTDGRALRAAVQVAELWCYDRSNPSLAKAFAVCVQQMQPSTRYLAYHAIAHVGNWEDRAVLFIMGELEQPVGCPECKFASR